MTSLKQQQRSKKGSWYRRGLEPRLDKSFDKENAVAFALIVSVSKQQAVCSSKAAQEQRGLAVLTEHSTYAIVDDRLNKAVKRDGSR